MFFKNFKVWETELAGRKLTLETGKMAMKDRFNEFTTLVVSSYKKMKKIKKQQSSVYATYDIR